MGDYDYDGGFHGKPKPIPCRGQVKAAIAASLARSVASVTTGITSTVKKSLWRRRSTFSGIRSNAASSFSSHCSSTLSQASGTCWGAEDCVEDTIDTNTVGHLRILGDNLYS